MKRSTRLLAILLASILCFSLIPLSTAAATDFEITEFDYGYWGPTDTPLLVILVNLDPDSGTDGEDNEILLRQKDHSYWSEMFFGDGEKSGTNYSVLLDLEITKDGVTGETKITGYSWTPIYLLDETDAGGGLRLLRMEHAIQTYEQEAEGSISEEDYLAMTEERAKVLKFNTLENKKVANRGGNVAGIAHKQTEKELGHSVFSSEN